MRLLNVQLCVVAQCLSCGRTIERGLPLSSAAPVRCQCGREISVGTDTLNAIEAMKARYVADLQRASR